MIDTVELHARIAARPEAFVATLFGDAASANKSGDEWRVGKNGSLKISLYNGRLGFCDFEGDAKRKDAVELWERVRECTRGEALRGCAAWAGLGTDSPAPEGQPARPATPAARAPIPDMPRAVAAASTEGREYLLGTAAARAEIAEWRGWPVEFVSTLLGAGIITAPKYHAERARIAFQTCEPVPWPTGEGEPPDNARRDRARFVGWHGRMRDTPDKRRGWRFAPSAEPEIPAGMGDTGAAAPLERDAHPGLPPLPLVLARAGAFGSIWDKRLLIVCEGEFDACTLPLALGWFDPRLRVLRIPPAVAIVGIVGAGGGTRAFLDAFRFCWPANAAALVLRDGDAAGNRWTEPGGFLDALRERCPRVASAHFGTGADGKRRDVNDAWRDGTLSPGTLDALLAAKFGRTLRDAEIATPLNAAPAEAGSRDGRNAL